MEYTIMGIIFLVIIGYKLTVRATRKEMKVDGRYLIGLGDDLAFLARPTNTLKTDEEIAGFNYLTLRPWRETSEHFTRLLRMADRRESLKNHEARDFLDRLLEDAGCSDRLALLCSTVTLPPRLSDIAHRRFEEWTNAHKSRLEAAPHMSVGYFMNMSSRAAAATLFESAHGRMG